MRVVQFYSRGQNAWGQITGLPAWARWIISVLAIPGILLAALSIVALGISILALLLLTVPAYWLLSRLTGSTGIAGGPADVGFPEMQLPRKPVDAKVVDAKIVD